MNDLTVPKDLVLPLSLGLIFDQFKVFMRFDSFPVADPGFPVGGAWTPDAGVFRRKCM